MKKIVIVFAKRKFIICLSILLPALVAACILSVHIALGRNPLGGRMIVIDAGHGGVDGGANSVYIAEKEINLDIALRLRRKVEDGGARAIMTRSGDYGLGLSDRIDRVRYISDLNARVDMINNSGADMFVSIHANASKNPSARGTIAFYSDSHPHNREIAYIFQTLFNTSAFEYNGIYYRSHHAPQNGGYYLLVNAKVPGVLIETGFITNSADLALLKSERYRQYVADTISAGITKYLQVRAKLPDAKGAELYTEEEQAADFEHDTK